MYQLSFFDTLEEQLVADNRFLRQDLRSVSAKAEKTHAMSDKVRKKLFAENGDLKKRIFELESRLNIIERNICQGALSI